MSPRIRIVHVEDNPLDARLVQRELRRGGLEFDAEHVHDEQSYLSALEVEPQIVLSDYALPGFDGMRALSLLRQRYADVPFILISGAIGEDLAVEAMRKGASDYLLKDRLSRLPTAVKSCLARVSLARENRALEERLAQAARLESLGRMSAGLAHDLNNILLPIMMAEELLRDEVAGSWPLELLKTIETSAVRGTNVLKQLLTFGRGTNNQPVPLRLENAISEVLSVMQQTFPKNVIVDSEVADPDLMVFADPTQVQQILLNLCVNARDAMREGGRLTLRVERGVVDAQLAREYPGSSEGPHAVLSVKDSGTGIAPNDLKNIFDPFFSTKGLEHGTGLGLSSVLGIVQGYGGFIQVSSTLEQGTEFRVWLRQYMGEEASAGAKKRSSGDTNRSRRMEGGPLVMVVDDEPAVLEVLGSSIARNGYRALLASDGVSALTLLETRLDEVAVLVVDFAMPRLDGLGLVREVRKRRADLPVVLMTAALPHEKRAELSELGVVDFLTKPFQSEALLDSIDHALSEESSGKEERAE